MGFRKRNANKSDNCSKWMDHIDDMDQLRQGIGLQAYGQRDPLVEYKMAGFDMFDEMIAGIQEDTIRLLYHVQVEQKVEREQVAKVTGTNKDESAAKALKYLSEEEMELIRLLFFEEYTVKKTAQYFGCCTIRTRVRQRHRRSVNTPRYIRMIRVHVAVVRNISSAADVRLYKIEADNKNVETIMVSAFFL